MAERAEHAWLQVQEIARSTVPGLSSSWQGGQGLEFRVWGLGFRV